MIDNSLLESRLPFFLYCILNIWAAALFAVSPFDLTILLRLSYNCLISHIYPIMGINLYYVLGSDTYPFRLPRFVILVSYSFNKPDETGMLQENGGVTLAC